MPTDHPHFPGKKIYWEKNGEKPVGDAFFAQAGTHSLSYYGKYGCGATYHWRNINQNIWNRQNLVYRKYSQNCSSPKANPDLALTTFNPNSPGAYVALCQYDTSDKDKALGSKYPLLWIPKDCNSALAITNTPSGEKKILPSYPTLPKLPTVFPDTIFKPISTIITPAPKFVPITPILPTKPSIGPTGPGTVPTQPPPYQPPPQYTPPGPDGPPFGPTADNGGLEWWQWLLLVGGGTAVAAVAYKKSKKKKGKRRKKGKK
jgi:hypothetical protein